MALQLLRRVIFLPSLSACRCYLPLFRSTAPRTICDKALLKLNNHDKEKERFVSRLKDRESFWLRLLSLQDSGNIFEEDLKMAWVLAEEEYLPSIIELTERYFDPKGTFISSFKFGPLMMRTCYALRRPDIALQLFNNPKLARAVDDAMSAIILMDMLLETGNAEQASSLYESLIKKEWFFVLRHPIIPCLYAISLYKQANEEALTKALLSIKNLLVTPSYKQKIEIIVAALAIKMKEPDKAISLVYRKALENELAWNIKIQGHILKSEMDMAYREIKHRKQHRLYEDTLEMLRAGSENARKLDLKSEPTTVEERILAPLTLEENKDAMFNNTVKKKFYG